MGIAALGETTQCLVQTKLETHKEEPVYMIAYSPSFQISCYKARFLYNATRIAEVPRVHERHFGGAKESVAWRQVM